MTNGWTGGQYSLFRGLLGSCLVLHFAGLAPTQPFLALLGIAFALALVLGFRDRVAAVALALVCTLFLWPDPCVVFLLVAHACIPGHPYGSLDARGRLDPGGGWRMPAPIRVAAWLMLAVIYAGLVLEVFELRLAPLALLHLFAFDPAWIRPVRDAAPARLFYDGSCGLCHGAVRFLLAEDRDGTAFRFAPLESDLLEQLVPEAVRRTLPDSLVLVTPDGTVATRSSAVLACADRLGGLWRALASVARLVPEVARDHAYDAVASVRHRLFARPREVCPLLPPELRARFD